MKHRRHMKNCIVLYTVFCVMVCLLITGHPVYAAGEGTSDGRTTVALGEAAQKYADVEQFPKSYRDSLNALKKAHPNWTFVKLDTGLDWERSLDVEMSGKRSLVSGSKAAWMRGDLYGSGWYYASREGLAFYMDPRNSLTESYIFQFEQLNFNEECHSIGALDLFLDKTFMRKSSYAPGVQLTFAELFYWLGKAYDVSPYHLAARVYQEQGVNGTSPLISGTYPGYEGYYNYFNVKASGATNAEVIQSGLAYAKTQGWTNAYFSIEGGTKLVGQNYISKGQYTLYLQKFNVNPKSSSGVYNHQYMQNISASKSEGLTTRNLYTNAGALNSDFVFVIPVFVNMPEYPCGEPGAAVPAAQPETAIVTAAGMHTDMVDTMQFTIVPDSADSIARITVNGEDVSFERQSDGSVLLDYPVALRHFADQAMIRLFDADGKGIPFTNGGQTKDVFTYSAEEYLQYVSDHASQYDENEVKLAKALSAFNRLSMEYFDGIAYSGEVPAADIAKLKATAPEVITDEGTEYLGSSLLIENRIVLRHYFAGLSENAACNGQMLQKKGDIAYTDIVLTPCELDEVITVQIQDGTEIAAAISYCPEYYMHQVLTESEDTKLVRLIQSLLSYEQVCNEASKK